MDGGPSRSASRSRPRSSISTDVKISQVYGGGGNAGAEYRNDFIELFNRSATDVSVAGWSVQYASSTGSDLAGDAP